MLLNKVDLLPHLRFDVARCIDYARRVNQDIEVMLVSATSGVGLDAWLDWIEEGARTAQRQHAAVAPAAQLAGPPEPPPAALHPR